MIVLKTVPLKCWQKISRVPTTLRTCSDALRQPTHLWWDDRPSSRTIPNWGTRHSNVFKNENIWCTFQWTNDIQIFASLHQMTVDNLYQRSSSVRTPRSNGPESTWKWRTWEGDLECEMSSKSSPDDQKYTFYKASASPISYSRARS
jgi:hypothetical protein